MRYNHHQTFSNLLFVCLRFETETIDQEALPRAVLPETMSLPPGVSDHTDLGRMQKQITEEAEDGLYLKVSKWGKFCPVSYYKMGKFVNANVYNSLIHKNEFFLFASDRAMKEFIQNPNRFTYLPPTLPPIRVSLLGPPNSGKTSLAQKLHEEFGLEVINVDNLVSSYLTKLKETEFYEDLLDGDVLSSEVCNNLVLEALQRIETSINQTPGGMHPPHTGWVLDGFPQTEKEARFLIDHDILPDKILELHDGKRINLNSSIETEVETLKKRSSEIETKQGIFELAYDTYAETIEATKSCYLELQPPVTVHRVVCTGTLFQTFGMLKRHMHPFLPNAVNVDGNSEFS